MATETKPESKRHSSIYLPLELHQRLRLHAVQQDRRMTEIIEQAIRDYLDRQESQP